MGTSVYRMYGAWRVQIIATSVLFLAIAIALLWSAAGSGRYPSPFTIAWSAGAVYVAQNFLWRVAYELRLEDRVFVWKTPLRSRSVSIWEIDELRPARSARNVEIIHLENGTRITVIIRRGFQEFLNDLAQKRPGLPIEVSPSFLKMAGRGQQRASGYEHYD